MSKLSFFILTIMFVKAVFSQGSIPEFKTVQNGKKALFANEKQLTRGLFESGSCYNGACRANKDGVIGFLNYNGIEIVPFKYKNAYVLSEGLIAVFNGSKWGFINDKGVLKIPFSFYNVSNFNEGLNPVQVNQNNTLKYGFINTKGEFVVTAKYDHANHFYDGYAAVRLKDTWGFINTEGKAITPFKYCNVENFKNGIAKVAVNCNFEVSADIGIETNDIGFINTKGVEIIFPKYKRARRWSQQNFIEVEGSDGVALYNCKGETIIPFHFYHSINGYDKTSKLIRVSKYNDELGYTNGFVNRNGKEVIPCLYNFSSNFIDDFIYGSKAYTSKERDDKNLRYNQNKGVLSSDGIIILPFIFEKIAVLKNGYFRVKGSNIEENSKYGYYTKSGKLQLPLLYDYATDFSKNGFALVKENGHYKFIDIQGNTISIPKYDEIDPYIFNDLTAVKNNNKWGFINAKNEVIINFKFDQANRFHNGLAKVIVNKKHGFINTKGVVVIPIKFDEANYYFTDELEELILNGKKYYFNKQGKQIHNKELIKNNGY